MGRIRTIKPSFFKHEGLFDAELETGLPLRLAFIALWTACDREGRFRWQARALKSDCLPFDDVDFSRVLDALTTRGFLVRYTSGREEYGCIPTFSRHQVINHRESASIIPPPPDRLLGESPEIGQPVDDAGELTHALREDDAWGTRGPRGPGIPTGEREGEREREGEGEESSFASLRKTGGGGSARTREPEAAQQTDQSEQSKPDTDNDAPVVAVAVAANGEGSTDNAAPSSDDWPPPGVSRSTDIAIVADSDATFREKLLSAMSCHPSGVTGAGGRIIGTQSDMLHADRWVALGLSEDEILREVADAMRSKADPGPPASFKYFDSPMTRLAAAKAAPPLQPAFKPPAFQSHGGRHDSRPLSAHKRAIRAAFSVVNEIEHDHEQ